MNLDADRITRPLRLARGSHRPGSGKGCAMNVVSYINGDETITDYPLCSARPLATMVQLVNDSLANRFTGYLSPENAMIAVDLGWQTVGTGNARQVRHSWFAELLDSPTWGLIRFADDPAVESVAALYRRVSVGDTIDVDEWRAVEDSIPRSPVRPTLINALSLRIETSTWCATNFVGREGGSIIDFTQAAIDAWRRLARLADPVPPHYVVDTSAFCR